MVGTASGLFRQTSNPHQSLEKFAPSNVSTSGARLRSEAAELLQDRTLYRSISETGNKPNGSEKLSGMEIASHRPSESLNELSSASAHQMSHNELALKQVNGEQAQKIAETNPTGDSIKALATRDEDAAVDLANKRADVAAVSEHNDELSESFHNKLSIARTGAEGAA